MRPYLTEGQFVPSRGNASGAYNSTGLTEAFASLPPLYGYVATTPKQRAQVVLATPRGDPLLAVWQHGLGHTMAWTADLKSQWSRDWVRSQAFVPQVAALVNYLLPEVRASKFSVASQRQGNGITVLAHARNERGETLSNLHVVGTLIASDGSRTPLSLHEAAPGSYTAQLGAMPPDVYEVQLTATNDGGQPVAVAQTGVIVANDSEYRGQNYNLPLLENLAASGGGRFNPPATALSEQQLVRGSTATNIGLPLLWVALLLWPLDVLLRRWGSSWVEWLQGLHRRWRAGRRAPAPRRSEVELGAYQKMESNGD
jgi:hypothetical protein